MGILLKPKPTKKNRMTTEEYFALGETELNRTLLIYGKLITMGNPTPKHRLSSCTTSVLAAPLGSAIRS